MINVKIDAELLANAKFGEQVEKVVNDIKAHVKTAIASLQPKQLPICRTKIVKILQ